MSELYEMNQCAVIQDILPLYHDDVCSEESRALVKKHLEGCAVCRKMEEALWEDENVTAISREARNVLKKHEEYERKRSLMIGAVGAGILMIPVIVCLICNLAVNHALDWFFIVLTSLLVLASVTIVPFVAAEKKLLWSLVSFTMSLLLLLFVINIYTEGRWFFLAAVLVIFGLSVVFAPFVIRDIPLQGWFSRQKGLFVMLWDTLWLYGVILVCGLHTTYPDYWRIALQITTFCVFMVWVIFLAARYIKIPSAGLPKVVKAGILTILLGIFTVLVNDVVNAILRGRFQSFLTSVDFSEWNNLTINANIHAIILLTMAAAGGLLIVFGVCWRKKQ